MLVFITFSDVGKSRRDEFIESFKKDPEWFEKPIAKMKCQTFASENLLKKNKSKKVQEIANIKGTRDLYGRLLQLSTTKGLDLDKVFTYPLLPEPPCFCHPDGSLRLSTKAEVCNYFKKLAPTTIEPTTIDSFIADGMFILRGRLANKCPNFASFCS